MTMDEPVNSNLSGFELIARNIFETSQYSGGKLKKNRFYPNYKRESRSFPGRHVSRLSVQRICHAGLGKATYWALNTKSPSQTLVGFEFASASAALSQGFLLVPYASDRNPFHAHIVIKELDLPYPQPIEHMDSIMNPAVRHRIDKMANSFLFYRIEDGIESLQEVYSSSCLQCLAR